MSQGVPQESVHGPLLFNIYLNNLLILSEFTDLCNFLDDTTFFASYMDLNSLIKRLEHNSFLAIEWLENNNMKLNEDKCNFLVSGYKKENVWAHIGNRNIWESKGTYIKYVGLGAGGFYKFFKKSFAAQETMNLNISWPSSFFGKYFMASPINFSFLLKAFF